MKVCVTAYRFQYQDVSAHHRAVLNRHAACLYIPEALALYFGLAESWVPVLRERQTDFGSQGSIRTHKRSAS